MKKLVMVLSMVFLLSFLILSPNQVDASEKTKVCDGVQAAMELKMEMRKLWSQHVLWTGRFAVSDLADLADKADVLERLLRNQDDIGSAIGSYFGEEAGNILAQLLREHILIAGQVVEAAKNNDKAALESSKKLWYENADQIAKFLADTNPNWEYKPMKKLLFMHLELLTEQFAARAKKDWAGDITAYDKGEAHIIKLADALSSGILRQFPEKFAMNCQCQE